MARCIHCAYSNDDVEKMIQHYRKNHAGEKTS